MLRNTTQLKRGLLTEEKSLGPRLWYCGSHCLGSRLVWPQVVEELQSLVRLALQVALHQLGFNSLSVILISCQIEFG